jgi:hypothetical protein
VRTGDAQVRIPSRRLPGFRSGLDGRAVGIVMAGFYKDSPENRKGFRALSAARLRPKHIFRKRSRSADLVEEFQ